MTSQSHSYIAIYQITCQELPTRNLDFFLLIFYWLIQSSIVLSFLISDSHTICSFLYRNIGIGNLNEDDFIFGISLQYAIANSHSALKTVPLRLPKEKLLWNWFGHILLFLNLVQWITFVYLIAFFWTKTSRLPIYLINFVRNSTNWLLNFFCQSSNQMK